MRRAFSVSVYVQSFTRAPVPSSKVLLVKHNRHGCFLPLGGELGRTRVEETPLYSRQETPLECARRKVLEEAGWGDFFVTFPDFAGTDIAPLRLLGAPPGLLGYEEHESGSRGLHMNFVFTCVVNHLLPPYDNFIPKSDGSWTDYLWVSGAMRGTSAFPDVPANVRQVLDRIFAMTMAKEQFKDRA